MPAKNGRSRTQSSAMLSVINATRRYCLKPGWVAIAFPTFHFALFSSETKKRMNALISSIVALFGAQIVTSTRSSGKHLLIGIWTSRTRNWHLRWERANQDRAENGLHPRLGGQSGLGTKASVHAAIVERDLNTIISFPYRGVEVILKETSNFFARIATARNQTELSSSGS